MLNNVLLEKEKICKLIDSYDVISFDVFDTLVLREVIDPKDIFKAVAQEYELKFSKDVLNDFHIQRHECEMKARALRAHQEDIIFDNIYESMSEYYEPEVCNRLKGIELELERLFIVRNSFMYDIYDYALKSGKTIFFVSDMYLSKDFLTELIGQLGYAKYDEFYVSCEHMKTKHHGSIYRLIKEEKNLKGSEWLHIGDNFNSDVFMATENGVAGYHYVKVSERAGIDGDLALNESIISAIEINEKFTKYSSDYWFDFGAENVARLYYSVARWVLDNIRDKVDNIYFLARDGYIIKKIVDTYFYSDVCGIKTHYLYTSRRAFQFVECLSDDVEELAFILTGFNPQFDQKLTCKEILDNLRINSSGKGKIASKYGLSLNDVLSYEDGTLQSAQRFIKEIAPEIIHKLKEEEVNLRGYLEQEGVFENKKSAIFDIGWRGSIQKAMQKISGKEFLGLYFGTNPFVHDDIRSCSFGFAIDKGLPSERNDFISYYLMVFELLFTAPHGSLQCFKKDNDKIIAELVDVEKNYFFKDAINRIQDGACSGVVKMKKYERFISSCSAELALDNIKRKLEEKRYEDLFNFSTLTNSVGFGGSEDVKRYVTTHDAFEYFTGADKIVEKSRYNLWPGAFLIKDGSGRLFTGDEFGRLRNDENSHYQKDPFHYASIEKLFFKKVYHYYKTRGLKSFFKRSFVSAKFIYSSLRKI